MMWSSFIITTRNEETPIVSTVVLEVECWKQQPVFRQLSGVLTAFTDACKQINRIVLRAQTDTLYGNYTDAEGTKVQSETTKNYYVFCAIQSYCERFVGRVGDG